MSRLTTSLKRVCAALMLCSSFPSALVHAQYVSFRIEAPQNIDYAAENYNELMNEIGTLKITFSPSNMFQDVDNYARYNLDLSNDEFQYNSSSKNFKFKYKSYTLNAFPNGENGVCWGNQNITTFNVRELQRAFGVTRSWPIYYRVYSPHFNRIIIGEITPSDEERITIRHDEWAKSRRVVFNPVIGREGNVVSARLAPDLRTGTVGAYNSHNMYDLQKDCPFVLYAPVGDTLRYLVAPQEDNLALHADSLKVTDTTTSVTTDYRKATLCYFYITDTKGNLCPTTNGFGSVYYPQQRIRIENNNGGTYGYGFYNVTNQFSLRAPDGTQAAYVLPGTQTFQFGRPFVETTDPDFLVPYNAEGRYVIKELTVPESTTPVSLSLGKSTIVRTVTTLASAAPYADRLKMGAFSNASRPYAWSDYAKIDIESREVSREVQGNDLVITTQVEGSTEYTSLHLSTNYSAQSDTVSPGIDASLVIYAYYYYPGVRVDGEWHFTQDLFHLEHLAYDTKLNFNALHPVKFIIPCHLMQEGYHVFAGEPNGFTATHHEGCAKSLAVGTESPVPYDTLTAILPEGEYNWCMLKGNGYPTEDRMNHFTLDATGPFEQHLPDNQFSLLRVSNMGVDSVYVFNGVPASQYFRFAKSMGDNGENKQFYRAEETIPLHAGYNERTIEYRQIKLEKDTFNAVTYWLEYPSIFKTDNEDAGHPNYIYYSKGSIYGSLDRMATTTPDKAINISTGSSINIATSPDSYNPAYIIEITPSKADTTISLYNKKLVKTRFRFNNGIKMPDFQWFNMCYNNQQTHVSPQNNPNFNRRGQLNLLPGHYTIEGEAVVETENEYEYEYIPIHVAFDVPDNRVVELNPSVIESISTVSTEEGSTPQAQLRYTIDGRRLTAPQRGINIIKMSDGTVRKVMVK